MIFPEGPRARSLGLGYQPTTINCLEMRKVDQLVDSQAYSLNWGKWAQHKDEKEKLEANSIERKKKKKPCINVPIADQGSYFIAYNNTSLSNFPSLSLWFFSIPI